MAMEREGRNGRQEGNGREEQKRKGTEGLENWAYWPKVRLAAAGRPPNGRLYVGIALHMPQAPA